MTSATSSIRGERGLRRPRAVGILAAAALIVAATYGSTVVLRPATPAAGLADRSVSLGVPGAADTAPAPGSVAQLDRAIRIWAANLTAEPRDFLSATTLAGLYHERGRLTGDLADHQRALEAAQTAIRIAPTEPAARQLEAAIEYTLHDFSAAVADAEALYRDDPTQVGALATKADAELELGRVAEARADYAVVSSRSSGPAVDVRLARLVSVTGQSTEALRLARSARDAVLAQTVAGETPDVGFYQFAVGEYARLDGDADSARKGYAAALALRDTDLGALVGLARVDAFEGRTSEAIAGLEKAVAIAPQPDTLALLGDLQAAVGDQAEASRQFETVRFIERLGELASTVFDRSLIRFDLDHGGASEAVLAKARASLATRPDGASHDTLAWALYRLGRFDEAATEIEAAGADGADDARLLFHRGAIALARGDAAGGRAALQAALAIGPALDPIERSEAEGLLAR